MSSTDDSAQTGRNTTEFVLVDDPSVLGVTRDKLGALLHSTKASGFTVSIRELNAVHGVWDETAAVKEYASLLIFRVQLHDHGKLLLRSLAQLFETYVSLTSDPHLPFQTLSSSRSTQPSH